jgi:hypothetical protein
MHAHSQGAVYKDIIAGYSASKKNTTLLLATVEVGLQIEEVTGCSWANNQRRVKTGCAAATANKLNNPP